MNNITPVNQLQDLSLIEDTIIQLRGMVEDSINYQVEVSPIYTNIARTVLGILNKTEELNNWEPKDLLKLFDSVNKAQLQPIEQLTKLVQSITALYERSALQEKMAHLEDVISEFEIKKAESEKAVPAEDNPTIDEILSVK